MFDKEKQKKSQMNYQLRQSIIKLNNGERKQYPHSKLKKYNIKFCPDNNIYYLDEETKQYWCISISILGSESVC